MFLRLQAEPENKQHVLTFINEVIELQPGDPTVLNEKEEILRLMRQG